MFEFDVVLTAGGKWAVAAFLKPQDWTNVAVTVKDGGAPKRVSSANVAQMFEATTNVTDWAKGRVEADVTDRTKDLATPVEFTVKSGDGMAENSFLRIRK